MIAVHGRAPLPRRDQPADRLAAVPDGGGPRSGRGDPASPPAGSASSSRDDEELSNIVLRAFLSRRSILIDLGAGVKVIGSRYSRDTRRLREFLARNRMPYQWLDLEDDEEADALLARARRRRPRETPVVIAASASCATRPTREVAALLGFGSRGAPPAMCDLVIVGAGPAGLAAAVYGASEGLDTQVIDAVAFGGQASTSSRIENYLGFPTGISGSELAERAIAPGPAVRRAHGRARAGRRRCASDDGHYAIDLADGSARQRAHRDRRHGRAVPTGSTCPSSTASKASASTTPRRRSRRRCAPATRS